jgi:hypothetical protein
MRIRTMRSREKLHSNSLAVLAFLVTSLCIVATVDAVPMYRLEFEGPVGDYISGGNHVVLTEADVGLTTFVEDRTGDGIPDSVRFDSTGIGELFFLLYFDTYGIPGNLVPGSYPNAQRSPFPDPGHPGFWLAWDHRGCNQIAGSFTISEASFGPTGPTRFSARFEQSCETFMPTLTGTFEFTSEPTGAPEPSTLFLIGAGLAGLVGGATRKNPVRSRRSS